MKPVNSGHDLPIVASVVGYYRNSRENILRTQSLGHVQQGFGGFIAFRYGFGAFQPECVGGAFKLELAVEMVREKAWYPSVRTCPVDGTVTRS